MTMLLGIASQLSRALVSSSIGASNKNLETPFAGAASCGLIHIDSTDVGTTLTATF